MSRVSGFPPEASPHARVLILGSMPGVKSLQEHQYYAHPRNSFWPLMGALFGAGPELPYAERIEVMKRRGVALWDVVATCYRNGSLDSAIRDDTVELNAFGEFFTAHPSIGMVFFNGKKSAAIFTRKVLPGLRRDGIELTCATLPSTSPAMAIMDFDAKLRRWTIIADALE